VKLLSFTVYDVFKRNAILFKDKTAIKFEDCKIKFGELFEQVNKAVGLACSRCGVRLDVCPVGIDVYKLQEALHMKLIAQGKIKKSVLNVTVGNRLLDSWNIDNILVAI